MRNRDTAQRYRDWACLALLAILSAAFFEAPLFRGKTVTLRDLTGFFVPWQTYARQCLADGELPLWCPHNNCGYPFLASIEPAVLYPLNAPFHVARPGQALAFFALGHTWLAGVFMYALIRALGCSSLAGVVASMAYMFGGWFVTRLEFLPWFGCLTWQPLLVLAAYRTLEKQSVRWALAWGCVLALQVLAGYPECALLSGVFAGLVGLGYVFSHLSTLGWRGLARSAGLAAVAAAVSLGVAAVQLLSTIELVELADRPEWVTLSEATARSVYPRHFLTWLVPRAFGGMGFHRYWGGTLREYGFSCYYTGILPVLLAAFALWRLGGRGKRWLVCTVTAIGLAGACMAMGEFASLYPVAFRHLPVLGKVRWPVKFMALPVMSLCLLAAVGLDAVRNGRAASRRRPIAVWVAINVAIAIFAGLLLTNGLGTRQWAQRFLTTPTYRTQAEWRCFERFHSLALYDGLKFWVLLDLSAVVLWAFRSSRLKTWGAAALVSILTADLFVACKALNCTTDSDLYEAPVPNAGELREAKPPFRVYVPSSTVYLNNHLYGLRNPQAFQWAKNTLLTNRNLPDRIDVLHSDISLDLGRFRRIMDLLDAPKTSGHARAQLLSMLNVSYGLHAAGVDLVTLVRMRDYRSYTALRWIASSPRAWVVPQVQTRPDDLVLATLLEAQWRPHDLALVSSPISTEAAYPRWEGDLRISRLRRHETTVDLDGGEGFLVLSETHYPGWRLYDNGIRRQIRRTNYAFRGSPVMAGRRELRFVYAPRSFKLGALLTLVGLAVICAASVARLASGTARQEVGG